VLTRKTGYLTLKPGRVPAAATGLREDGYTVMTRVFTRDEVDPVRGAVPGDPGRMLVRCYHGRRGLAQRFRPTSTVNHLSYDALARAITTRQKTLAGLHPSGFYDG
jgi:hypothetical protein